MPEDNAITEDVVSEFEKFHGDFSYYAPRCLKIQTMEGALAPFEFNVCQRLLIKIFKHIRDDDRLIRTVVLKARREGVSTFTTGRFYHKASMGYNRYAVCVTHEPEATDFLFKMIKRYHQHVPKFLQPQTTYSNQKLLEFNAPDGKGLDSAFRVGTAQKDDFGSGQLIHYFHGSEVAKWPREHEGAILNSILQTIPDLPETEVVLESTAKGIGGEFYDRYWGSRYQYEVFLNENGEPDFKCTVNEKASESNEFSSIFIPWFVFEKYTKKAPEGFERTPQEQALTELHGLDDDKLTWRRWCIENKCRGKEEIFQQEYPSNPKEAFLVSGIPVFDNQKVMLLKEAAPPPKVRYEVNPQTGQFVARDSGELRVWEEPRVGKCYIIGGDVSEGLPGKADFSVLDVIDHRTGEQVAHWHGKCEPGDLGRVMAHLGKRYNMAWVAPERNNHGYTTVTILREMKYPRIYMEMADDSSDRPRKRFGWVTSTKTRTPLIDTLIEAINDDGHGIKCAETFDEMLSFKKQDDGKMEADTGQHDDRVISIGIAKEVRKKLPLPSQMMQQQREADFSANGVSKAGWGASFEAFT